jgi:quercetin dioxygenase-like cupin family protein
MKSPSLSGDTETELLFNHSSRVYYFGALTGLRRRGKNGGLGVWSLYRAALLTMFPQRGIRMSLDSPSPRPVAIDRASSTAIVSRTSWGEESHIRIGPEASGGQLTILDYRAPAGFGPPRHLHQRDDEVIELVDGQVVVWTPEKSFVLAPGDLVLLPKHVPHTWRAYGAEPIRFTVTFTPSGFERFFPDIERLGLVIVDVSELTSVASDAGMEILGPPLSDEEVRRIIAEAGAS